LLIIIDYFSSNNTAIKLHPLRFNSWRYIVVLIHSAIAVNENLTHDLNMLKLWTLIEESS